MARKEYYVRRIGPGGVAFLDRMDFGQLRRWRKKHRAITKRIRVRLPRWF